MQLSNSGLAAHDSAVGLIRALDLTAHVPSQLLRALPSLPTGLKRIRRDEL